MGRDDESNEKENYERDKIYWNMVSSNWGMFLKYLIDTSRS